MTAPNPTGPQLSPVMGLTASQIGRTTFSNHTARAAKINEFCRGLIDYQPFKQMLPNLSTEITKIFSWVDISGKVALKIYAGADSYSFILDPQMNDANVIKAAECLLLPTPTADQMPDFSQPSAPAPHAPAAAPLPQASAPAQTPLEHLLENQSATLTQSLQQDMDSLTNAQQQLLQQQANTFGVRNQQIGALALQHQPLIQPQIDLLQRQDQELQHHLSQAQQNQQTLLQQQHQELLQLKQQRIILQNPGGYAQIHADETLALSQLHQQHLQNWQNLLTQQTALMQQLFQTQNGQQQANQISLGIQQVFQTQQQYLAALQQQDQRQQLALLQQQHNLQTQNLANDQQEQILLIAPPQQPPVAAALLPVQPGNFSSKLKTIGKIVMIAAAAWGMYAKMWG